MDSLINATYCFTEPNVKVTSHPPQSPPQVVAVGRKSVVPVDSGADLAAGERNASYALRLSRRQADALFDTTATQKS